MQHEIDWRTALEINKKYNKRALELIRSKFPGENLDSFFQNWLWWIFSYLPLSHAVRVMDCFLVEGQKVLLRTCLALVKAFSKNLKSYSGSSSDLNSSFIRYCKDINIAPNDLLDKSFRFRGLSRASISKKSLNIEVDLKAKGFKANGSGGGIQLPDDVDSAIITHDQVILLVDSLFNFHIKTIFGASKSRLRIKLNGSFDGSSRCHKVILSKHCN